MNAASALFVLDVPQVIGMGDSASAKRQIALARALDSHDILEKFVDEMRRWVENSPHSAQCFDVPERLRRT